MYIALLVLFFAAAGAFFAFRYFSWKRGLREIQRDLSEILQDISRNQILHMPLPDRELEQLILSVNTLLEEVRRERLSYEKREAEFGKLIENVSHDLRTPLTVILGYLKWIKKAGAGCGCTDALPGELPDRCASQGNGCQTCPLSGDALEILERNARAMEKLVSQFYDFSRLNARDYGLELSEIDVCRILRESIVTNYRLLEEAHLSLDSSLPAHPVVIRGDADALERIFSNLFQNAGRYARSFLDVRLEEDGAGKVNVIFQNDSEPVTEEELAHLFDRFYKKDDSRHQYGSGLGLTVAKSLAELMGGTLTASLVEPPSQAGSGRCATLIRFAFSISVCN